MKSSKSSNEPTAAKDPDTHGTITWAKVGPYLATALLSLSTGYFISTRDSLNQAVEALRNQYKDEKAEREKLGSTVTEIRFELQELNHRLQNVEKTLDERSAGNK